MVTHTGIEQPAAEATAACGGNRKPKQAQRSQKASPAQGAQPDAVTASRNPASASRGAKTALRTVFRAREMDGRVTKCSPLFFNEDSLETKFFFFCPLLCTAIAPHFAERSAA